MENVLIIEKNKIPNHLLEFFEPIENTDITKGSVMPTSVKDRFNESGEELYFFVKNKKYYSNLDAVRLKNQTFENRPDGIMREREFGYDTQYPEVRNPRGYKPFNRRVRDAQKGIGPQFRASEEEIKNYSKYGKGSEYEQKYGEPWDRFGQKTLKARMEDTKNKDQKSSRTYNIKKLLSEVRLGIKPNTGMVKRENIEILTGRRRDVGLYDRMGENVIGKNLPSVWLVGSEPHNFQKELDGIDTDHFATFPEALLEIPIKFGCPKGGIVLDCFGGAGTSAIVAKKLGRNYILIELNPKYVELAEKRIRLECPQTLGL